MTIIMSNLGLPCLLGFFYNCNDNLSNIIIARTVIKKCLAKIQYSYNYTVINVVWYLIT